MIHEQLFMRTFKRPRNYTESETRSPSLKLLRTKQAASEDGCREELRN